jgi:GTPase SAR1 family protein
VAIIGDGRPGKTSLIERFVWNTCSENKMTEKEVYVKDLLVYKEKRYRFSITEYCIKPDTKEKRMKALEDDNLIVLLCYSVVDVETVKNLAV